MKSQANPSGRGVFYTRDSGGNHEMTPTEYVEWAQREAGKLGVVFSGTSEGITKMIRSGSSQSGDIFLDFGVKGNVLSRDGLNALLAELQRDSNISHVFIPRRDRLARPDNPLDGVKLENVIRGTNTTVVYTNGSYAPIARGSRQQIGDLITSLVDFDKSGEDRRQLAQKILDAQVALAKLGFSTGGRPAFGFRRWLAKLDGTPVRQLAEGERVRMAGHHVVWLPDEQQMKIIRRILEMLETMPAARVAAQLTAEGVPSPDAGRWRTDNGVRHQVRGDWHATTIINIARNPLLIAVVAYGRRSMGDQLRFSPDGPRELTDADFRDDEKPKVIRNPEANYVTGEAKFEPCVEDVERHQNLIDKLNDRAGCQRGKPRSKDRENNPLGCRVFDMACGWPMYRTPHVETYRYKCGCYMQSHGTKCAHNTVDGPTATRFVIDSLRQRIGTPRLREKLQRRLRSLAEQESAEPAWEQELSAKQTELAQLDADLDKVARNLALADGKKQHDAISQIFDELMERRANLEKEVGELEGRSGRTGDLNSEVDVAMSLLETLSEGTSEGPTGIVAREIFDLANARLFLNFQPKQVKRRVLNKIVGGMVTFGSAPPPFEIYGGPTGRRIIKGSATKLAAEPVGCESPTPPEVVSSGGEGESLGNRSRGDRTSIELFSNSLASWTNSLISIAQALAT
ncbi:MAG: recombinase family protein [Planctomycetota bacterium]|nr:recombinase family protein [Planctomycetota bacterium]